MKTHKFDVDDAEKYGVQKALLLEHLKFHQENNVDTEHFNIDGKVWCEAKRKTLEKIYSYFNGRSMSRWLNELENAGVIESRKVDSNGGKHAKLYHVKGHKIEQGQNDHAPRKSRDTVSLQQGQNDQSSIVTYVKVLNERECEKTLPEKIQETDTVKALSDIWFAYRKEKNKWPGLSEQEMIQHKMSTWGLPKSKKIVSEAITNGWLSLKEDYLPDDNGSTGLGDNNKLRQLSIQGAN